MTIVNKLVNITIFVLQELKELIDLKTLWKEYIIEK